MGPVTSVAPSASAMVVVLSVDPPSETTSRAISPAASPGSRDSAQPGNSAASFSVGMMTVSGAAMRGFNSGTNRLYRVHGLLARKGTTWRGR